MARTLTPDLPRRIIGVAACAILLFRHSGLAQFVTLLGGAMSGVILCRSRSSTAPRLPAAPNTGVAWISLALFGVPLIGLSGAALLAGHGLIAVANVFYRSGAFVFGGGHVVLPLLQQALVPTGWVSNEGFLAGYGFAQAIPGPLFTLAAYLGAISAPPHHSLLWALTALIAIFLPGLLLANTGLSLLGRIAKSTAATSLLAGINAAVVGLLAAALYNPVWTGAVHSLVEVAIIVVGFLLLQEFRTPPIHCRNLCRGKSHGEFAHCVTVHR